MAREDERKNLFKKTVDNSDGRRRRQETTRQIRKAKKDENLLKRRMAIPQITATNSDDTDTMSGSKKTVFTIVDIPQLAQTLANVNSTIEQKAEATRGFRRLLSVERNPPVHAVIDSGVLPMMISNLTSHPTAGTLIFESAWALTNIASTSATRAVVDSGAIIPLIQLLRHAEPDVREQAAWCVGNIAGDSPEYRDLLLANGALEPLILNMQNPANMSLLNNVTWTVSNLCRGKPAPEIHQIAPAIPALAQILSQNVSTEVLVDAVWALSYISDGPNDRIEMVMQTGIAQNLVSFLTQSTSPLLTPCLRCLGNFVTGDDMQTQRVIDAGILNHLGDLLESSRKTIRKEACWLASNITAGTVDQIASLMQKRSIMTSLIDNAINSSWEVRKEAIWALSNICTTGDDIQVMGLVQAQGLQPLADVLSSSNIDTSVLMAVLEAVEKVLAVGEKHGKEYCELLDEYGGVENLEQLQEHPSDSIYQKTIGIIEKYFGAEEPEDENLAPTMTDSGTFGFGISSPKQLFPTEGNAPVFQFGVSNRAF